MIRKYVNRFIISSFAPYSETKKNNNQRCLDWCRPVETVKLTISFEIWNLSHSTNKRYFWIKWHFAFVPNPKTMTRLWNRISMTAVLIVYFNGFVENSIVPSEKKNNVQLNSWSQVFIIKTIHTCRSNSLLPKIFQKFTLQFTSAWCWSWIPLLYSIWIKIEIISNFKVRTQNKINIHKSDVGRQSYELVNFLIELSNFAVKTFIRTNIISHSVILSFRFVWAWIFFCGFFGWSLWKTASESLQPLIP